jgi:tubulin epsilon
MGLILRGKVSFSDVNKNIKSLREKKNLKFINWNNEGFKYGICNVPPHNMDYSLLCLANNTCIRDRFKIMRDKYWTMYKRKLYTHQYAEYMDLGHFDETLVAVDDIIKKYQSLETSQEKPVRRLRPLCV